MATRSGASDEAANEEDEDDDNGEGFVSKASYTSIWFKETIEV